MRARQWFLIFTAMMSTVSPTFGEGQPLPPDIARVDFERHVASLFGHGATDAEGGEPTAESCSPDDLSATIFAQLGFPTSHAVTTQTGRPVPLFRNGRAIEAICT